MNAWLKAIALTACLGALGVPVAALADPPAAGPPTPPSVFVGAPTTTGAQGGAFTLNFNDLGRFEGVGRSPDHPGSFNLTPEEERRQARVRAAAQDPAAVDRLFLTFLRQLRTVDVGPGSTSR